MLQALSEELSRKAATLVLENENLKRVCYYSIVVPSYNEATFFCLHFILSSSLFCFAYLYGASILDTITFHLILSLIFF